MFRWIWATPFFHTVLQPRRWAQIHASYMSKPKSERNVLIMLHLEETIIQNFFNIVILCVELGCKNWHECFEFSILSAQTFNSIIMNSYMLPKISSVLSWHSSDDKTRVLCLYRNVSLGQYLGKGENLLLVLLRHFGWQPWRDHLTELRKSKVREPDTYENKYRHPRHVVWIINTAVFCSQFFLLQSLLEAQSVRVLVVSYGCLEGAAFWLDQTGTEFDMLFDEERTVSTFYLNKKSYLSFKNRRKSSLYFWRIIKRFTLLWVPCVCCQR